MSDSVEFQDGVYVAGPTAGDRGEATGATGSALLVRPTDALAVPPAPGCLAPARPGGAIAGAGSSPPGPGTAGGRTSRRRPRPTAVAVAVAGVLGAVAVGAAVLGGATGSPGHALPSGSGALAGAAGAATTAQTAQFTLEATQTAGATVTTLVTGSGAFDLTRGVGRLSATVPALAPVAGGAADTVTVVTDGAAVYVDAPALASLTGRSTWLKATLPTAGSAHRTGTPTLALLADPGALLALFRSVGGPVTTVGPSDLAGTPTTEYRTTVTAASLAARAAKDGAAGSKAAAVLRALGSTAVPVTAWVGTDGYLRQLTVSADLVPTSFSGLIGGAAPTRPTSSGPGSGTATTVTVGFSHYGQPVDVQVPPASEVTDLGPLVGSLHTAVAALGHAVSSLAARF